MAPALTAGATTTEPQYIRVPDSAGARPMHHHPARPPGSADRIGRATNTTDTTHTMRSANTHELTIEQFIQPTILPLRWRGTRTYPTKSA